MKKILAFLLLLIALILLLFFLFPHVDNSKTAITQKILLPTSTPMPTVAISSTTLFVPYWTLPISDNGSDQYIYFGIQPDEKGINLAEDGYKNLKEFTKTTSAAKTLLTVRMIDAALTQKILQEEEIQNHIIQDALAIAKTNHFSGIILDLEYSGLAFPSVTKSITDFSLQFAKNTHDEHLLFYQAVYGDTFYLARPYDIKHIAQEADGIFVMSYDFHKANGTPGPNFPLQSRADSDYNFSQMVKDFSKEVPKEKLTIIFGMFGYDWIIDEKGRSIGQAKSLSANDLQKTLQHCTYKDCMVAKDKITQEPTATYSDSVGQKHIVWWEDLQSVDVKKTILEQQGINKIGFWANGYY